MNNIFPYSSPIIMNDAIYQLYGGDLSLGSSEQLQAAYLLAEIAVTEDINTLLLPMNVTGTFSYKHPFLLTYGYVNSVSLIRFYDFKEALYYTISGTANIYASIKDKEYGELDIVYWIGNCACHSAAVPYPYKIEVAYNAGLPTGTANQPNIEFPLKMYSKIMLNEIVGYGNEAPGDIGVQEFKNQQYSEKRVKLLRTTFGTSAEAQLITKLLTPYRKYRYVSL